jgi:hypothetical protein
MRNALFLLLFLFYACTKDYSDPKLIIKVDLNGKDWIKSVRKDLPKIYRNLFGKVYKYEDVSKSCEKQFIGVRFGFESERQLEFLRFIALDNLPTVLGKYNVTDNTGVFECEQNAVKATFVLNNEMRYVNYSLDTGFNNTVEIIKIDRVNKFIEGRFDLIFNNVSEQIGDNPKTLNFQNGYFKIPYTIDI